MQRDIWGEHNTVLYGQKWCGGHVNWLLTSKFALLGHGGSHEKKKQ